MEEDIDIYDDLSISHEKSLECEKCSEWETKFGELTKKVENLQKVNRNLELNISSLLLTAKAEVARKDRMIGDLRRQLDDASFRRGRYQRHLNSEYNEKQFERDGFFCNQNVSQPSLPEDFKTVTLQPQFPVHFDASVPPPSYPGKVEFNSLPPPQTSPPLQQDLKYENTSPLSPDNYDEAEYICKPELYLEDEEDPEQKYEEETNRETLYTKRLRKRLEMEHELEQKEKERIIIEEAEKKENERLRLEEAQEKENERLRLEEAQKKENERLRLEEAQRKENERLRLEEAQRKENERLRLDEAQRKENERLKLEEAQKKENERLKLQEAQKKENERLKLQEAQRKGNEQLMLEEAQRKENERLRFEESGQSSSKINVETKENKKGSVNTLNKRPRAYEEPVELKRLKFEPSNEPDYDDYREDWSAAGAEAMNMKKEMESSNVDYDNRKDAEKKKEDERTICRDVDKYENSKYENNKYKDKFLRERYEKDKCKEKLEKQRHERDKYKHEREKLEREKFEREKFDRKSEKDRHNVKRSRRSISYSPERNYKLHVKTNNRQKGFKEDHFYNRARGKGGYFNRNVDLRQKISRFGEQEYNYKFRMGREIFQDGVERNRRNSHDRFERERDYKSRSNSKEKATRREMELRKEAYDSARSRSNSKENTRRVTKLRRKSCNFERSKSNGKDAEMIQEILMENSESNSRDIDQRMEEKKRVLEMQKAMLEMELKKMDIECSKSNKKIKELEEGELSDSSQLVFPSQIHETKQSEFQKLLDNPEKKIVVKKDLEKGPVEKCIENSQVEKEKKIENITNQSSQQIKDSKPLSLNKVRIAHKPVQLSKEIKKLDPVAKNEIPNTAVDTKFFKPTEKDNLNQLSEVNSCTKLNSKLVKPKDDSVKHIETLDSFLESAMQVLEENKKEAKNIGEISKNVEQKKLKKLKIMKDLFSPVKEKKQLKITKSKEIENKKESVPRKERKNKQSLSKDIEEGEILSPVKENEKQKRSESTKSDGKQVFNPEEDTESIEQIQSFLNEDAKIRPKIKEDIAIKSKNKDIETTAQKKEDNEIKLQKEPDAEIKMQKNDYLENVAQKKEEETKTARPLKEFNPPESKKGDTKISSPVKEKKKQKRSESKKKEDTDIKTQKNDPGNEKQKKEEEIKTTRPLKELNPLESKKEDNKISSPVKEKKKQKRSESKKNSEKQVSSTVEDTEKVKQKIGEAEMKTTIKEAIEIKEQDGQAKEIKETRDNRENITQETEETKTAKSLKDLNPTESKKEGSKMSSPVKGKRAKIELEPEVLSSVKDRRKPIQQEEVQPKLIESQKLKEVEPKQKEVRKPVQKVKEVVPEKPKTKKAEDKSKKNVVIVRKRRRPIVLSDCNASTTIVSNQNIIKNINLNNGDEKNLLSAKTVLY